MGLPRFLRTVPECPLCDGPCTHELTRSPFVFSRNLPEGDPSDRSADPEPEKPVKENRRGRRAIHGPEEDRAIHPSEDRSK